MDAVWGRGGGCAGLGYTGEWFDASLDLQYLRARWYDGLTGGFASRDPWEGDHFRPQSLNGWTYAEGNPVKYLDPSGRTVRSALDLIRAHREDIKRVSERHSLDSVLLAGVVFAENRNDLNWFRGQDWSSVFTLRLCGGPEVKNLIGPWVKDNVSIGITEVTVAVAAMMDDDELVPDSYPELTRTERATLHDQIASSMTKRERRDILDRLSDPQAALDYSARYLAFLGYYRDYGDDYALWLSDYNRGLSDWETTTEYGQRVDVYRRNIEHVLNWTDPDWTCVGGYGCGVAYDRILYGELP